MARPKCHAVLDAHVLKRVRRERADMLAKSERVTRTVTVLGESVTLPVLRVPAAGYIGADTTVRLQAQRRHGIGGGERS